MISKKTIDELIKCAQFHEANALLCVNDAGYVYAAMRHEYQYNLAEGRKYRNAAADLSAYNEEDKRVQAGAFVRGVSICQS